MKEIKIPPMLNDLIMSAILSVEGLTFSHLSECPYCKGPVKPHDTRRKKFAYIRENGVKRNIFVFVKRYYCSRCGRLCYADAPFYPETRLGSPIVDFCIVNIGEHPYHHIAQQLDALNIIVDRGTIRNYARRHFEPVQYFEVYGFRIPVSLLALSEIALNAKEGTIIGAVTFSPPGLPPADRALLHALGLAKKGEKRKNEK
jgi:hypothetical protein